MMKHTKITLAATLALVTLASGVSSWANQSDEHQENRAQAQSAAEASLYFDTADRQTLKTLLDKRADLRTPAITEWPAGSDKRLAKGKALPPGVAQNVVWLPNDYNQRLGISTNANIRVAIIGDDAIVYDVNKSVVLDVLENVF